jgi:hypothetical protein
VHEHQRVDAVHEVVAGLDEARAPEQRDGGRVLGADAGDEPANVIGRIITGRRESGGEDRSTEAAAASVRSDGDPDLRDARLRALEPDLANRPTRGILRDEQPRRRRREPGLQPPVVPVGGDPTGVERRRPRDRIVRPFQEQTGIRPRRGSNRD